MLAGLGVLSLPLCYLPREHPFQCVLVSYIPNPIQVALPLRLDASPLTDATRLREDQSPTSLKLVLSLNRHVVLQSRPLAWTRRPRHLSILGCHLLLSLYVTNPRDAHRRPQMVFIIPVS